MNHSLPLLCPIASIVLRSLPKDIREAFITINDAREHGSPNELEELEKKLAVWLEAHPDEFRGDSLLSPNHAIEAALGDCKSVIGRWDGDGVRLVEGVELIRGFVKEVDGARLNDSGTTHVRAHGYLGNALTRQAYVTQDPETLLEAIDEIKNHPLAARDGPIFHGVEFHRFRAANHRDLGDAYVGQLHWSPEVPVDGAAIEALKSASRLFAELSEVPGDQAFTEWAATQSSLAVALAKTAVEIHEDSSPIDRKYCPQGGEKALCGKLVSEAMECAWQIWRIYVGLLHGPTNHEGRSKLSFRWARTVSNIAFAGLYVYRLNRSMEIAGAMAESAFISVLGLTGPKSRPGRAGRGLQLSGSKLWYGEALRTGKQYNLDDHRHRFLVNQVGAAELYKVISDG